MARPTIGLETAPTPGGRIAGERLALLRAAARLLDSDSVEEVGDQISAALRHDLGQTQVDVYVLDEQRVASLRLLPNSAGAGRPQLVELASTEPAAIAVRTRRTVHVPAPDGATHARGAELALPLRVGQQVMGALVLAQGTRGPFSAAVVKVLTTFAERAALALDRAALRERLQRRTRQLEHLHAVALLMGGEPSAVLGAIVRQAALWLHTPHTRLERVTGERALRVAAAGFDDALDPAGCALAGTPGEQALRTRRSHVFHDTARHFPGDAFLQRHGVETCVVVPILDRAGLPLGLLTAVDRRRREFGEDDLRLLHLLARRAAEELEEERRRGERAAAEERLQQAERLAALGEMVAGVAHDINNPLASILALSEVLARRPELSAAARAPLQRIGAEAARAGRVVHNLLGFAGRHSVLRVAVHVNALASEVLAQRADSRLAVGIRASSVLAPDLPVIYADPHQLQQLLGNLLFNAEQALRHAGRPGTITLRSAREPCVAHGTGVTLHVEDDGPGIPAELRERVFEPFFTTKPLGQGTGLGLSLARRIAERHGGELQLHERPGGGARFTLCLPIGAPAQSTGDL